MNAPAARPEPPAAEIAQWRRRFASEANNRAWDLIEQPARTPAETDEMLEAAQASTWLWRSIGTDVNAARGRMLLAYALGLAGQGAGALAHAQACLGYFASHECPDWEIAFAHGAVALAARAAGDARLHQRHLTQALQLRDAIADPEDRAIVDRTFRHLADA